MMISVVEKFGVGKEILYAYQGCIYVIKNTVKAVILRNMSNVIYSCDSFIYNPKSEKVGTVWKTQIKKENF